MRAYEEQGNMMSRVDWIYGLHPGRFYTSLDYYALSLTVERLILKANAAGLKGIKINSVDAKIVPGGYAGVNEDKVLEVIIDYDKEA